MATYYMLREDKDSKFFSSPNYNYVFNKSNGFFARWGSTRKDDPSFSPFGPEILDLEISKGSCLGGCKFCYKCNGHDSFTQHMTLETFDKILDKMPNTLTQIAFGITDIYANPDFFAMMHVAKTRSIIPNYTTHGLDVDKEAARLTYAYCGAVAISLVNIKKTLDAAKLYKEAGCKQVNIHFMLSEETYDKATGFIKALKNTGYDKLFRAIVFLHYKPKGRNPESYSPIRDIEKYKTLIKLCEDNSIGYGFDSCSCGMYYRTLNDKEMDKTTFAEPCESGIFSSYISSEGFFYPCSFTEGEKEWEIGIDVVNCKDFVSDVWYNERVVDWRNRLLNSTKNCKCKFSSICRDCLTFGLDSCKVK